MPLESGDRLSRAEFERRYTARPDIKKAELIEGVVYVASPVRVEHGRPHGHMMFWLASYEMKHPECWIVDNGTARLDPDNEPQPDGMLFRGQETRLDEDGYLDGPPELVVEVAASSASYNLGPKMSVYRRNGVSEYVVWQVYEERIDWFRLGEDGYELLAPNDAGIIESVQFPGLRLDVPAMLRGDLAAVLAALG